MNDILCRFVLMHLIVSNVLSFKHMFSKMNKDYIFHRTKLVKISGLSFVYCAARCRILPKECSRFSWSSTNKMCIFSSNEFVLGYSGTGLDVYSVSRKECMDAGYDYDIGTNTCLRLYQSAGMTWFDARTTCQQDSGDLISITTKEKFDFVYYYKLSDGIAWIGLKENTWLTGEEFQNVFGINTDLDNYDEYASSDTGPACGALKENYTTNLMDFSCTHRPFKNFLCEIIL